MRKLIIGLSVVLTLSFVGLSTAKEPTKEETVTALVDRGLAHIKAKGLAAAIADFNDSKGKFVDGEFYLFAYDYTGKCIVLGTNPKMVGKNQIEMTDADGKLIIQEFISLVKTKGRTWYSYKWSNPTTKKIQDKMSLLAPIPGENALIGSGFYK